MPAGPKFHERRPILAGAAKLAKPGQLRRFSRRRIRPEFAAFRVKFSLKGVAVAQSGASVGAGPSQNEPNLIQIWPNTPQPTGSAALAVQIRPYLGSNSTQRTSADLSSLLNPTQMAQIWSILAPTRPSRLGTPPKPEPKMTQVRAILAPTRPSRPGPHVGPVPKWPKFGPFWPQRAPADRVRHLSRSQNGPNLVHFGAKFGPTRPGRPGPPESWVLAGVRLGSKWAKFGPNLPIFEPKIGRISVDFSLIFIFARPRLADRLAAEDRLNRTKTDQKWPLLWPFLALKPEGHGLVIRFDRFSRRIGDPVDQTGQSPARGKWVGPFK